MKRGSGIEIMSDFNFTSKYAKYDKELNRRELWEETIDRMKGMHLRKYVKFGKDVLREIEDAFQLVKDKRVLASQRAMQFGGPAIEKKHMRIYNCSTTYVDRIRSFSETFYMLLCGCGVGYSVQKRHTSKLPNLIDIKRLTHDEETFIVEDSIEGWADASLALISSFFEGNEHTGIRYNFDYSQVRKEGSPLSHGGKAPGPKGLKKTIEKIREIFLDRVQSGLNKLRTIDAHDIQCHLSDAVLSGGVRRSACISIFDLDDELMLNAKVGNWMQTNPQRGRANNSVVIIKGTLSEEKFHLIMENVKQYGEPGFLFLDHPDHLFNPCSEISMCPLAIYKPPRDKHDRVPDKYRVYLKKSRNFKSPLVENYTKEILDNREKFERYGFVYKSGWGVCNLTELNGKKIKSKEEFKEVVRAGAIIGTCQAGFTDHGYLLEESQHIIERESLLGISITGIQDSPDITLDEEIQREMAEYAIEINKEFAKKIGVNQAARITCTKPAGNSSILLQCGSGIHAHHARRFFRRIQVNKSDNVFQYFQDYNPHAVEESVWSSNATDDVITFPIEVGAKANLKSEMTALEFLGHVLLTQKNWIESGTARPNSLEGARHNVSNTVDVAPEEWEEVTKFIFENQKYFSGISLLSSSGDKIYQQAPMETCYTRKQLIDIYGEKNVKHAERIEKRIRKKLHVKSVQEARNKFSSIERLNGDYNRKFRWILENCIPYNDDEVDEEDTQKHMETKYEYEARCDNEYTTTIAIYKDIRYKIKIDDLNSIMDLLASVRDEGRWDNLTKKFKKVDYSKLIEEDDETDVAGEQACSGGACEISFAVGTSK